MSRNSGAIPPRLHGSVTVPFRRKFNEKEAFLALFREGMALVEEAANYLDGTGRRESKCLAPYVALSYATESMRLTARLTQLATWLLARRAVLNGEQLPPTGSANDPLLLPPITRISGSRSFDQLPQTLRNLIEAAYRLHQKIADFDTVDRGGAAVTPPVGKANPVAAQLAQLHAAFAH
jgi:regulator of CtrA degradation